MECDHSSDANQSDRDGDGMRVGFAAEHNLRHLKREAVGNDHADVNDDETDKKDQANEMETTRCLSSAKNSGKPGKARSQRRRHHDAGHDLQRRQNENDEKVGELLSTVERVPIGRSKMSIGYGYLPRRGKDRTS